MLIQAVEISNGLSGLKKKNQLNTKWARNIYLIKDKWKQITFYSKVQFRDRCKQLHEMFQIIEYEYTKHQKQNYKGKYSVAMSM